MTCGRHRLQTAWVGLGRSLLEDVGIGMWNGRIGDAGCLKGSKRAALGTWEGGALPLMGMEKGARSAASVSCPKQLRAVGCCTVS